MKNKQIVLAEELRGLTFALMTPRVGRLFKKVVDFILLMTNAEKICLENHQMMRYRASQN